MLITELAILAEIVRGRTTRRIAWASLLLAASAVGLALASTVRNARRLGAAQNPPPVRTALARRILDNHVYRLATITVVLCPQLSASG